MFFDLNLHGGPPNNEQSVTLQELWVKSKETQGIIIPYLGSGQQIVVPCEECSKEW